MPGRAGTTVTSARIDTCPTSARQGRGWISISATAHVSARMLDRLAAAAQLADAVLAKVGPGFAVGGDREDATMLKVCPRARGGRHGVHPRSDPRAALGSRGRRRALAIGGALEGSRARPRLAGERGGAGGAEGERGTGRNHAVPSSR